MFRKLYDWMMRLAGHRRALPALAAISFAESSFFPIPPDVMLVPMVLAQRSKAFVIAGVCTVASVIGGLFGYAIGYFLFETIGAWVIQLYNLQGAMETFRTEFAQYGTWIILVKGLTPIPYKLVTIASGVAHFDLFTFVWASILTRGVRFFAVAGLLWKFGDPIRNFIEKRLEVLTWAFLVVLIGGFVAVKYVF
jgi:membrane protein YqaA with SNARE-associated domain